MYKQFLFTASSLLLSQVAAAESIISISSENDTYASGTDRNYTNGAMLSVLSDGNSVPDFLAPIMEKLPNYERDDKRLVSFSIGQNMYTPKDIARTNPDQGDRPYAGLLYASMGVTLAEDDLSRVHDYEIMVGVVGPASMAAQTQTFVHHLKDVQKPKGWGSQLDNEPAFMVSYRERFPHFIGLKSGIGRMSLTPHVGASLGNVLTSVSAGGMITYQPEGAPISDVPALVRPSLPGTGYYESSDYMKFQLFAGAEGRYVAHSIFLDGNSFDGTTPSIEKKPFVLDLMAGASLTYKDWRLGYSAVYRSKEFYGQEDASIFGALNLAKRF